MSFSAHLRALADPIWEACHRHPFVQGLKDGSLSLSSFIYYLRQDYVFLIDYARLLALGAAKAEELESMGVLSRLLYETLHKEMGLHRDYCRGAGISEAELEATQPSPTTLAYTSYLLRAAYQGGAAEAMATLLPCLWSYAEIGQRLAQEGDLSEGNRYATWIRAYAAPEYEELVRWARDRLDRLATGSSQGQRLVLEDRFLTTSRYEYLFWEGAYQESRWPV